MNHVSLLILMTCAVLLPLSSRAQGEEQLSMDDLLHKWVKLIHQGKTKELLESAERVPALDYQLITTPLIEAAKVGNVEMIEGLLKNSADVNNRDPFGDTALHAAMRKNQADAVSVLLKNKADPFAITHYYATPLGVTLKQQDSPARDRFLTHLRSTGRLEQFLDWQLATFKVWCEPERLEKYRAQLRGLIPEWGDR